MCCPLLREFHEKVLAKQKLRAVIIGCGRIAGGFDEGLNSDNILTHAKSYILNLNTKLVAIADVDVHRAERFSSFWGNPRVYTNIESMLADEQAEVVSICSPDDTHEEMLAKCLTSKTVKAVWCEKPIATNVKKAEELVSEYEKRGIILAVNYQRRWQPQMKLIKESIANAELGNVQKIVVYYSKGICHNGSHAVDLLSYWYGLTPTFRILGHHFDYTADDPTVDACLDYGGLPVYLVGFDESAHSLFEIQIIGTKGRVNIKSSGREIERYRVQPDPQYAGYQELWLQDVWVQKNCEKTIAHVLEEIVAAIYGGGVIRSDGRSALVTLRICKELAYQAMNAPAAV